MSLFVRIRPLVGAAVISALAALPALAGPGDPLRERAQFGQSVAVLGDVVYVAEPAAGSTGGVVRLYRRGPTGWRVIETVKSPIGTQNDGFGYNMTVDGTSMLVTAINGQTGIGGTVSSFRRDANGTWVRTGTLNSVDPKVNQFFGAGLALSGDEAAVGATREGGGTVHLYRRGADGAWQETGTLKPPEAKPLNHRFGATISWKGDWIAVGASSRDSTVGTTYLFHRGKDGSWGAAIPVTTPSLGTEPSFGTAVLLDKDELFVGAPGANHNIGVVMVFRFDAAANRWQPTTALSPFGAPPAFGGNVVQFGSAMTMAGGELWVGAPTAGQRGAVYRMQRKGTEWIGSSQLAIDSVSSGAALGTAMAASGSVAAVAMPQDAGTGTVVFLTRGATGNWSASGRAFIPTKEWMAINGTEVKCEGGKAKEWECGNTGVLAFMPTSSIGGKRGTILSGNWGWTDPETGKDYALIGRNDGTSFVDVTDPTRPRYLGDLPKPETANVAVWKEIKTLGNYALIVADGAGHHGIQIFDLRHLRTVKTPQTFKVDAWYDQLYSIHDIMTNDGSGFAYAVGSNGGGETCGGGYHMIDMKDPLAPKFVGCAADTKTGRQGTGYSHDGLCRMYHGPDTRYTGKEICVGSNETALSISDLTDKKNPVVLSRATYPDVGYTHQGWWTEDMRYFYVDDELDETSGLGDAAKATRTLIFDMAKLDDPVFVGPFLGTTKASDHNLYVKGNRMYQSNYVAGLRIIDITDPVKPREVGFFDVAPGENAPGFSGAWNNYPFFKNGAILVNNMEQGIFLIRDRTQAIP